MRKTRGVPPAIAPEREREHEHVREHKREHEHEHEHVREHEHDAGAAWSRATAAASPAAAGSPKRAGRPRDVRASRAITDAALRQLAETGYANMSMESVAAEAGVARATIYRRYRDKADLVTSAIATGVSPPASTGEPLVDLVASLEEFDGRFAEPCLEIVGSLLGARTDPSAMTLHRDRVIGPRKRALVALVTQAKDAALLRGDTDPDLLVEMLVGAVLARRLIGLPADRGWARRAVEAACVGAATAAGIAQLRRADTRHRVVRLRSRRA